MDYLASVLTHAKYNQWINQSLYDAAQRLNDEERCADLGAFFGSVQGTLNHLIVGDSLWLRRFLSADIEANESLAADALAWLPQPTQLDQTLFDNWNDMRACRARIDQLILDWTGALHSADLDLTLHYRNSRGRPFKRRFGLLLVHFFNHQAHHRGQASTLLFQNGVDPGATDLLAILPAQD